MVVICKGRKLIRKRYFIFLRRFFAGLKIGRSAKSWQLTPISTVLNKSSSLLAPSVYPALSACTPQFLLFSYSGAAGLTPRLKTPSLSPFSTLTPLPPVFQVCFLFEEAYGQDQLPRIFSFQEVRLKRKEVIDRAGNRCERCIKVPSKTFTTQPISGWGMKD
jgi:hypothetical protein